MFRWILYKIYILFYSVSEWFRWHFTKTGKILLVILLFATIFGLDTRNTLTFQLASLLAFLLLIAILSAIFQKKNFRVSREILDYATIGKEFVYDLIIVNNNAKPNTNLEIVDQPELEWPDFETFLYTKVPGEENLNFFDRYMGYQRWEWLVYKNKKAVFHPEKINILNPGEQKRIKVKCTPVQRGSLRIKGTIVALQDPLGLFKTYILVGNSDNVLLLPGRYSMPKIIFSGKKPYQPGDVVPAYSVGENMEISSLREYRHGDPLRFIHWRSWAKYGKPIVKEFTEEYIDRQGLILDNFLVHKDLVLFEEAVTVAASVAGSLASNDSLLDFVYANDAERCIQVGRGKYSWEYVLKVLATIDGSKNAKFEDFCQLVLDKARFWSGCVCIFLNWAEDKQNLVRKLRKMEVQVLVLIISETNYDSHKLQLGPMEDVPHMFRVLPINDLSRTLMRL